MAIPRRFSGDDHPPRLSAIMGYGLMLNLWGCLLVDGLLTVNYCPVSMVQLSWFTRTVCSDCATGLLLASIRTG